MTATERLRELLDERGVEWTYGDGTVSFSDGKHWCHAWAYSDSAMCVSMGYFTPEQTIDATLGRGTCRNVGYYIDGTRFKCSACGFNGWTKYAADGNDRVPNYCPNCGREVVGD